MKQLTPGEDEQLATTPTEELLNLEILQPENMKDTLHAYQMAKRCNERRVMAESVKWGEKGARLNTQGHGKASQKILFPTDPVKYAAYRQYQRSL